MPNNTANRRLLFISQTIGIVSSSSLILSAVNPNNHQQVHAFWSEIGFLSRGIGTAFSVSALRYHMCIAQAILCLGIVTTISPFLMYTLGGGRVYWMERTFAGFFLLYVLSVGAASRALAFRAP